MKRLVPKHPRAIRWAHWINFPILTMMIYSGLLIYWANGTVVDGQFVFGPYRIGYGETTLVHFFPQPFYEALDVPYNLAKGMAWHFFFMWIFAINGLVYVIYTLVSGEWRLLVPEPGSFRDAVLVTLHDLHLRKEAPLQGKYNGAQRIAYSSVVVMGVGSLLTGLAIYRPVQVAPLTSLLGGYEWARWEHFWLTMGYVAFFVVHVAQVAKTGWNNFRGMVTGYEIVDAKEDEVHGRA